MHDQVRGVTNGGLLHDIGKVLHRGSTGDGRAHSVSGCEWVSKFTGDRMLLDCIRYHHHQDVASAGLEKNNAAYIVYLADNIASGADRREIEGAYLPLFSNRGEDYYFYAFKAEKTRHLLQKIPEKIVRVYSKNTYRTGLNLATRLWLGDYAATGQAGELKTFAALAGSSKGIDRIGVLRADVDNMGLSRLCQYR